MMGGILAQHTNIAAPLVVRGTLSSIGALAILYALPKELAEKAAGVSKEECMRAWDLIDTSHFSHTLSHQSHAHHVHGFASLWATMKSQRRVFLTAGVVTLLLSFVRPVR